MSRLVQIDETEFRGGAHRLFSPLNVGKDLILKDDKGVALEVTLETCKSDNRQTPGGPVRIFGAFTKVLDGTRTVFRYAELRVYKGYGYKAILTVE